eukprot:Sspe_Gene.83744::Locus_54929_Transcript_1_1_Confidence_1.000_Length_890::g.83744::m.83744
MRRVVWYSSRRLPQRHQTRGLRVEALPHSAIGISLTHPKDIPEVVNNISNVDYFRKQLPQRDNVCNSVWVVVPMACGEALPALRDAGFKFHHATGDKGVLYKWTGSGACRVPDYATHRVGVAGVVVNSVEKLLLVKEAKGAWKSWKLPGGHVDVGEDLHSAAAREVREETGVESVFEHVIGIRHSHGLEYGRSDLYIPCKMRLAGSTSITPCQYEIETADWRDISDLAASKSELNRQIARLLERGDYNPIHPHTMKHALTGRTVQFYWSGDGPVSGCT